MSEKNLESLKIKDAEFSKGLVSGLATRPNRPSAYGESAMSAQQVKEHFDKNPTLLRERFNELLEYLPKLGADIVLKISDEREISLSELVEAVSSPDELRFEELLKVTYGAEETTLAEAIENIAEWLAELEETRALNMQKIDADRLKAYEEDGGYYFSVNNWNTFLENCNRVYVERSDGRGPYGMYALSYSADPIRNAWYSKDSWETDYAAAHSGQKPTRAPLDEEYPLLDSVVQRHKDGQIVVPLVPTQGRHAASKEYTDKLFEEAKKYADDSESLLNRYAGILEKMFSGTDGLEYELVGDHYVVRGLGSVPNGSHIKLSTYKDAYPVTEIASSAFPDKTIKSIRIPETINKFGFDAFGWDGNVDTVYIENVARWAEATFESSGSPVTTKTREIYIKDILSKTLIIPNVVTKISSRAFMHWKQFTSIILPEGLEIISDLAFQYCAGLQTLTIPASVKTIGSAAIDRCTQLKSVLFEGKPDNMAPSIFDKDTSLTDIYVKWNKGEIPGAPWAAPNATVWYYRENEPEDQGDYWHYVDGVPTAWEKPVAGTEGLEYMADETTTAYICTGIGKATDKTIVIPDEFDGKPVRYVGINAFGDADVETILLPKDMLFAYGGSLSSNSIKKIVVRNSVESLDNMGPELLASWGGHYYNGEYTENNGVTACTPVIIVDSPYSGDRKTVTADPEYIGNESIEEIHVSWTSDHPFANNNAPWGAVNAEIIYESEESLK